LRKIDETANKKISKAKTEIIVTCENEQINAAVFKEQMQTEHSFSL